MMKSLVAPVALAVLLCIPRPATCFDVPTPDYEALGMVCHIYEDGVEHVVQVCSPKDWDEPDVRRYADLVALTLGILNVPSHPPVTFNILPYKEFEFRAIIKFPRYADSFFGDGLLVSAYCQWDETSVSIDAYAPMHDKLIVHEFLHSVLQATTHRGLMNSHDILNPMVDIIITSTEYKAWLRLKH